MRVGVILQHHSPGVDQPSHFVSRIIAEILCTEVRYGQRTRARIITAVRVSPRLIWLQTAEPWAETKRRVGGMNPKYASRIIPRLLPPIDPINLDLAYPEVWRTHPDIHHPHGAFRDGHLVAADLPHRFIAPVAIAVARMTIAPSISSVPAINEVQSAQTEIEVAAY